MKTYHCILISDSLFQLELKASEPWLSVIWILPKSIRLQAILCSADRKQTCIIYVVKNISALYEYSLLVKLGKLLSLTHKHKPVLYQISENRSSNHKACNHIITTTVTFVMKYILISKDPTQNNTRLFTWKSI